jgi:hypothetical protein
MLEPVHLLPPTGIQIRLRNFLPLEHFDHGYQFAHLETPVHPSGVQELLLFIDPMHFFPRFKGLGLVQVLFRCHVALLQSPLQEDQGLQFDHPPFIPIETSAIMGFRMSGPFTTQK